MMLISTSILALFTLTLFSSSAFAQDSNDGTGPCFSTSGTRQSWDYQPCAAIENFPSFCCALNRTPSYGESYGRLLSRDRCLPVGLCMYNLGQRRQYWREGCTDQKFPDPACRRVCEVSGTNTAYGSLAADERHVRQRSDGENELVTPCNESNIRSGTKWCCGDQNSNCCHAESTEKGFYLPPIYWGLGQNGSNSSSINTSNSDRAFNPGSYECNDSSPNCSGLGAGAGAGIGVGVTTAVFGLVAALLFALQRRRAARNPEATKGIDYAELAGQHPAAPQSPRQVESHEVPAEAGESALERREDGRSAQ